MTELAYVFPGQGSQSIGMGQALAMEYPVARAAFAEADQILGFSLSEICFAGPSDALTETQNAQPAVLTASVAAWRVLGATRPDLPPPCCLAGHSLGEYAALVAGGALEFADAVRLTRRRGEAMARAGAARPGSMAAIIRLGDDQVAAICRAAAESTGSVVEVANFNSPGQVVISGALAGVAAAAELAKAAGGRVIPLAVSVASHSALMRPAAEEFADAVMATPVRAPEVPVIANVTACPLLSPAEIRDEMVAQLTSPVQWTASVNAMSKRGADRFIEVGPGSVLAGLIKRILPSASVTGAGDPAGIAAL